MVQTHPMQEAPRPRRPPRRANQEGRQEAPPEGPRRPPRAGGLGPTDLEGSRRSPWPGGPQEPPQEGTAESAVMIEYGPPENPVSESSTDESSEVEDLDPEAGFVGHYNESRAPLSEDLQFQKVRVATMQDLITRFRQPVVL